MADLVFPGELPTSTVGTELMPTNVNLRIYAGDDFDLPIELQDANSVPIDLTGYTGRAQFRRNYDDTNPVEATVTINQGGTGLVVSLTSAQTELMSGDFIYDLQLTNPAGKKRTYLTGDVTVSREVTR